MMLTQSGWRHFIMQNIKHYLYHCYNVPQPFYKFKFRRHLNGNLPLANKTMASKNNYPLKWIFMSIKPGEESNYCFSVV